MEIKNPQDITKRFTGIIWGDTKCGKTTYAMSLPGKKLLINFDPDGFLSVLHREDIEIIDLSQYDAQTAMKQAKKIGAWLLTDEAKEKEFSSVIVDSLTTLTQLALEDAIARGIGKSAIFTPTLDAPGLSGYGARNSTVNDVLSRLLRATAQKSMHLFMIAHSDDPEFDKKGENIVQQTIMLSAKIRSMAGLKASEIYYMNFNGKKRTIYVRPYGVKKPMGSRIFDTSVVEKFDLNYDYKIPDEEQPHSLGGLFAAWEDGGMQKLTTVPK